MSNAGAPREWHPLLTVKNLLLALTTVASLTFGLFTYDMERGLTQLNILSENSNQTAASVQVLVDKVNRIDADQNKLASEVTDHDKRIAILETLGVTPERRHRN